MKLKFQISADMNKGPSHASHLHMVSAAYTHMSGTEFLQADLRDPGPSETPQMTLPGSRWPA